MSNETFDEKNYSIMVVDDEVDLVDILAEELQDFGYTVYSANGGGEAIEKLQKTNVDLVITDIKMPAGTGLDLLSSSKELDPSVPIFLMMTGYSDYDEQQLIEKGATKLLSKPIDFKNLALVIKEQLVKSTL
jgi:CheY-like chemotaxis protein